MNWFYVSLIAIGAGVAVGGAFTPAKDALIPLGSSIVTAAFAHAMPRGTEKKKISEDR